MTDDFRFSDVNSTPLNPTTIEWIRAAAIQAVQKEDVPAAVQLLSLINTGTVPPVTPQPQEATPQPQEVTPQPQEVTHTITEGSAHTHEYWSNYICQKYFPHLKEMRRDQFTSYQLLKWLERHEDLPWTTGDKEKDSRGRDRWRSHVSYAIGSLKDQGIIKGPPCSKEYEICSTSQTNHDDPSEERV